MSQDRNSERGQALILITLAIVVLLGFTALAVDASMVYSDRRFVQSAADSAAMAGVTAAADSIDDQNLSTTNWNCSASTITTVKNAAKAAAIASAAQNEFTMDANISDDHGVTATCYSSSTDKYIDVEVRLTAATETGFSHLITDQVMGSTVTAIARVRPGGGTAGGYTIIAMNPNSCSGLKYGALFNGNTTVKICGGGIISNGCMRASGYIATEVKGTNCTSSVSTGAYYVKDLRINPDSNAAVPEIDSRAQFDFSAQSSRQLPVKTDLFGGAKTLAAPMGCHISPYPIKVGALPENFCTLEFTPADLCKRAGATKVNGSDLPSALSPGLYCITGDVKLSGSKGTLTGTDVTLVFLDGGFSCTGNCKIQLKSPANGSDAFPAVEGLLFYSLDNATWKLNGNNQSFFFGSIFLPYADVEMMGTGNEYGFYTQVCAFNFHTGGTNDSKWRWDDNYRYKKPPTVELNK